MHAIDFTLIHTYIHKHGSWPEQYSIMSAYVKITNLKPQEQGRVVAS